MSNVWCKEFTGWVKSFTKIERALTLLEVVLLVVLIALLILLILHFIVCSKSDHWPDQTTTSTIITHQDQLVRIEISTTGLKQSGIYSTSETANELTAKPDVKCSWTPSAKTTAEVHYHEDGRTYGSKYSTMDKTTNIPIKSSADVNMNYTHTPNIKQRIDTQDMQTVDSDHSAITTPLENLEALIQDELSEGEEAENEYDQHVVALVKLKPPKDIIFGCILTIVSEHWTLTAASCIEGIEETDSVESFMIMEHYGTDRKGPLQAVDDVQIHPLYEGRNKTYDLAALKSATSLTRGMKSQVGLASFLDYALVPLAEKFIILGYGGFRTIDNGPTGLRLRQAYVYRVPVGQCEGAALRHLGGGRALRRGACGAAALCAGVLYSRGPPCYYCAGTPLLSAGALLGLMADTEQCGLACEPALYVNLAAPDVADWVDAALHSHTIQ